MNRRVDLGPTIDEQKGTVGFPLRQTVNDCIDTQPIAELIKNTEDYALSYTFRCQASERDTARASTDHDQQTLGRRQPIVQTDEETTRVDHH